jgi:hypothetical protein
MKNTQNSTVKWMIETRKQWEKKSEKYRKRYAESGDPKVLAAWFKVSAFALKAGWFQDAIMELRRRDELHAITEIFTLTGRGNRHNPSTSMVKNMMLMDKIDRLVAEGMTKRAAFQAVAGDYFNIGEHRGFASVKNSYYKAKRYTPEVYVDLETKK